MANVDVIITTIDKSSKVVNKIAKENMALSSSLEKAGDTVKKFATQNATLLAGLAAVGLAAYKTIDATQKYNQEVYDMMLTTKGTAEETSKLIQVVDDTGVSYDTLKNAMKLAVKNGVQPNIESIAALSDEYLALKDPVKQGQLLMEKFGKSGLEMGRVMVLGGDALRKMSAEMEGGLVLTQDNIEASEEYRKNLDQLNDSVNGLKTSIGNALIPVINESFESTKDYSTAMERAAELTGSTDRRTNQWVASLIMQSDAMNENSSALRSYTAMARDAKTATADLEVETINLNSSYGDLLKNAMSLTSADQDFAESQQDIKDQQAELMTEKAGLYAWETKEIATIQGKIDDLSIKYDENATEHEKRTQRVLLDMSLEKIAMSDGEAGFSEAEYNKALALAETAGAAEASAIRQAAAMDAISTAIANPNQKLFDMKLALEEMTAHGWTVDVAIQMQNLDQLREALTTQNANVFNDYGTGTNAHATGGDFLIPMSYGNEGFKMGNGDTASGGERVSITPKGQVGQPSAPQLTERGIAKAIVGEMIKHGMGSMGR